MLPSTTTTSRSNRGGGGPKHRRGGLRNKDNNGTGSAASSDDESVRKGRKVHFSADSQTQSSSAASRGQRANNANRGASSSRGGRAASARGGPASSTASNPLAQIKAHIGGSNTNGAARGPAPNSSTTNLLQSFEERYVLLKEQRPHEKAEAIKNGTYQDPDKQISLSEAITIVGECQDMCPEYERVRRVREMDVWAEEATPETAHLPNSRRVPIEEKMVKKFVRAAAGMEEQLPSDLRPPHVLQQTLDYLIDDVVANSQLGKVHHFIWDRTRCIRNDFSIQEVKRREDVELAMASFERIARFHIVSSHQLRDPESRGDRYDPQQEREQLDKTLLSLLDYYKDNNASFYSPNEAEFRAYQIVFELKTLKNDIQERLKDWDPRLASSPRVQACMNLHRAACVFEEPLGPGKFDAVALQTTEEKYRAFWQYLASDDITYNEACIAENFFNALRSRGFRYIWRASRRAMKDGQDKTISCQYLSPLLGFNSAEETSEWVKLTGTPVDQNGVVGMSVPGGPKTPDESSLRSSVLVEQKRKDQSLPAIINNFEEEEGLFVPETAPAPSAFNPQASSFTPKSSGSNGDTAKNNTWTPAQGINFSSSTGFGGASQPKAQMQSFSGAPPVTSFGSASSQPVPAWPGQHSANGGAENTRQAADEQAQKEAAAAASAEAERKASEEAARQRAEMARAEAEQRRLAQEAEARKVAEQAAKQRAAEEAQRRREMQAREAAERERLAQAEAAKVAAQRSAQRQATLDTLAHTAVTQSHNGFLEQFIQFLAAPIIAQNRDALLERQAIVRVKEIYKKQLTRKFALRWRTIFWHRKIAQQGKARRQRAREAARKRTERVQREESQALNASRGERNVSGKEKPGRDSVYQSSAAMPPPPRPDRGRTPDVRQTLGQSQFSQSRPARLAQASPRSPREQLQSARNVAGGWSIRTNDKTASNYFKLQSMGIQPSDSLLMPVKDLAPSRHERNSTSKRSHEEYAGGDGSHSYSLHASLPPKTAVQERPPKRQANEASLSPELGSSTNSRESGRRSTADIIAESNKMLADMAETSDWFKDETDRMTRDSAASSRRSSFTGRSMGHGNADGRPNLSEYVGRAFGSPAAESAFSQSSRSREPLKYRSRASKFLSRDQYADAGGQEGRLSRTPEPSSKRQRSGSEAMLAADRALDEFKKSQAAASQAPRAAEMPQQPSAPSQPPPKRPETNRMFGSSTGPTATQNSFGSLASTTASQPLFGSVTNAGVFGSSSVQPQSAQTTEFQSNNLVSSTPPSQPAAGFSFGGNARPTDEKSPASYPELPAAQPRSATTSFLSQTSNGLGSIPPKPSNGAGFAGFKLEAGSMSKTETQRQERRQPGESKVGETQISPPSLKRKADESEPVVAKKKPMRKPAAPSNINPFAVLSEGADDEDTTEEDEEDMGVNGTDDDGQDSSVGFSEDSDHGDGQGNDFGTDYGYSEEEEDEGEESYDEDEELDEEEERQAPAAAPLIDGRGGTSIEDAIEL